MSWSRHTRNSEKPMDSRFSCESANKLHRKRGRVYNVMTIKIQPLGTIWSGRKILLRTNRLAIFETWSLYPSGSDKYGKSLELTIKYSAYRTPPPVDNNSLLKSLPTFTNVLTFSLSVYDLSVESTIDFGTLVERNKKNCTNLESDSLDCVIKTYSS